MPNFSENLNLAWKKSGLSKGDIAERLGVERSTVSRWFAGTVPSQAYLSRLANLIGTTEQFLVYGKVASDAKSETLAVKESGPDAPYRTKKDTEVVDEMIFMKGLLEEFLDTTSEENLLKMLQKFGNQLVVGDLKAASQSKILINMIRERRPEVFKPTNTKTR